MGMLITIFLIETSIYGSIKAPEFRGFGQLEVWYFGIQIAILFANLEYGFLLVAMKYVGQHTKVEVKGKEVTLEHLMKMIDLLCFTLSLFFCVIFGVVYVNRLHRMKSQ